MTPQEKLLGLKDYEIHYMKQGLHLMIEELDEIDATEIVQVFRDEKKCLYLRKFIVAHIMRTGGCFDWRVMTINNWDKLN